MPTGREPGPHRPRRATPRAPRHLPVTPPSPRCARTPPTRPAAPPPFQGTCSTTKGSSVRPEVSTYPRGRRPGPLRRLATLGVVSSTLLAGVVTTSATLLTGAVLPATSAAAADTPTDLARFGTATADKVQSDSTGNFPASNAIDGNDTTRWASGNGTDSAASTFTAVLTTDLGASATISGLTVKWEASYASTYRVEVASVDPASPSSWTQVYATTTSTGGTQNFTVTDPVNAANPVKARYIRLDMDKRGPVNTTHYYGYSIYTLSAFGTFDTPQVGFGNQNLSVAGGSTATVPLTLSNAAATDQTVHVRTSGGSATAGVDYTGVDTDVTFPAGALTASVSVPTTDEGALVPTRTVGLTLTAPSAGIVVGNLGTSTLTITPKGTPVDAGTSSLLDGFESGVPTSYTGWGSATAATPVLSTVSNTAVPNGVADNHVLQARLGTTGSYYGFTFEPKDGSGKNILLDWSNYDGFSFYFLGKNTGKTFNFELHNRDASNAEVAFDQNVVDNSTGWRKVSVLFSDLRLKSNHAAPNRFNPTTSTGFAVTLTGFGATGDYTFDDFTLFSRSSLIDDFESPITLGSPANQVGYFASASTPGQVTAAVSTQDRGTVAGNHVLGGTYQITTGATGSLVNNLTYSQDWSSYRGLSFWWYASQPVQPASATTGAQIPVQIKVGSGASAQTWTASFIDNWANGNRWKLVKLPFISFAPVGGTADAVLDLSAVRGFSLGFPDGTAATPYSIDDVQVYGTPLVQTDVSVSAPDVTLVNAGQTAHIGLTLTTASGQPTSAAVAVKWATGVSSATAADYTAGSGTLTFPIGTTSGTTLTFDVKALAGAAQAAALTIPITLTNPAVQLPQTAPIVVVNAHGLPYLDSTLPTAQRVSDLLGRMSLAQKAGQMAQAERGNITNPRTIASLGLGSLLSGGGSVPAGNTPAAWQAMIDGFQTEALASPLQIPLLYGADAVHGHSNVKNATIFPHNIGLGATRDPALVEKLAKDTASETKTTGVNWAFAPCLCVSRDERWGRTYESFGEDPALVTSFAGPNIIGLQGSDPTDKSGADEVLASAKHWAGDGGTSYDASKAGTGAYPIDQGITNVTSMQQFKDLYTTPYVPAIAAGIGTIMPSYSSVSVNGSTPIKMSANKELNTDLLKTQMGFSGFLISDWLAIDQIPGANYKAKTVTAVNAGMDMAMAPSNYPDFITAVISSVGDGTITIDRVNDAVSRILTQKFELGLFEHPFTDTSQRDQFGGAAHRADAADAAAKSQVLLKNTNNALPLATTGNLYVAGSNANDLGNQMGGWTISWQGGSGNTMTAGTTILQGIQAGAPGLDVHYSKTAGDPTAGYTQGLVVVGETPYAEGQGDVGNNGRTLNMSAADKTAVDTVCAAMKCTVLVISGRPQLITPVLGEANAVVAGFLPGSEGEGVADVLLGTKPFTGRLPLTWPSSIAQVPINVGDADYNPAFAFGWGLRTDDPAARLVKAASLLPAGPTKTALSDLAASYTGTERQFVTAHAPQLVAIAAQLNGTDQTRSAAADLVVSLPRDVAQAAMVAGAADLPAGSAAASADAEHTLLTGQAETAARALLTIAGISADVPAVPETTATTSPATADGAHGWFVHPVTVTLTATGGNGARTIEYKIDGAAGWTEYTAPVLVSAEGTHTVSYRSRTASATEETRTLSLKIDTIAPVVGATVSAADPAVVTLTATDAVSGVDSIRYRVNGGQWNVYTAAVSVPRTGSAQTVEFSSTDQAGNTGTTGSATVAAKADVQTNTVITSAPTTLSTKETGEIVARTQAAAAFSGRFRLYDGTTLLAESPVYQGQGGTGQNPVYEASYTFREAGSGLATGRRQLSVRFVGATGTASSTSAVAEVSVYFTDTPPDSKFYTEISWLSESGITTGNADGTFAPGKPVSRQAMAAFLYRLVNPGATAPACTVAPFADVPVGSDFCGEISWLKSKNITTGFEGNTFRPGASIERQAMAAFLYRLEHPAAPVAPACTTKPFNDVPVSNAFCGEITWLVAKGVTTGYDGGLFKPTVSVERQAMAAFLYRLEHPTT
ncbi:hypothetical protein D1871_15870 [Nakamurella silvestris]|nr:hypothetical protein D1871_15870 [Nakamurella silvestris]